MPGERIPEHELLRLQAEPEQSAPDNSSCRLGKAIRTFFRFARAPRLDTRKNVFQLDPTTLLFSEQDSLGGHGNSAEMSAAITERLTNHNEFNLADASVKIGTQMPSSDRGRVAVKIVLFIEFPPRIKNSAAGRFL